MLEHLFGSKTRFKLLKFFFRNPDKVFYVRELTRLLDTQINAVRRELSLLEKADLVQETDGKPDKEDEKSAQGKKYYRLRKESLLYPEIHALLLKDQVLEEQAFVEDIKQKGGAISLFLLTGRFTTDKRAPSDILLVGTVKEQAVANIIHAYEKEFGFEIRYTIMTGPEFHDRRQIMDKFLYSLFEADHLTVINALGVS